MKTKKRDFSKNSVKMTTLVTKPMTNRIRINFWNMTISITSSTPQYLSHHSVTSLYSSQTMMKTSNLTRTPSISPQTTKTINQYNNNVISVSPNNKEIDIVLYINFNLINPIKIIEFIKYENRVLSKTTLESSQALLYE